MEGLNENGFCLNIIEGNWNYLCEYKGNIVGNLEDLKKSRQKSAYT